MPKGRKFLPGEAERLQRERRLRQEAMRPKQVETRARAPRATQVGVLPTPEQRQRARPTSWVALDSSRVRDARYDPGNMQLQVHFRDGTPWVYEDVPPNVWRNLKRSASPGRFVNRVLNDFPYHRGAGF